MYNPYEFQNDLTRSQSEMGALISGRAEQLKAMQAPGILKKAEALKKKGIALQKGAQDVQSAIELGLGAPIGPVISQKIINPVLDKISEKFPEIGRRIEQGKGMISDFKGQVQKIGGELMKNNPIKNIQDEIQSRISGVQDRVSGIQEGIESKVAGVQDRVSGIQEGIESKVADVQDRVSDVQSRVSGDGGETKGEAPEETKQGSVFDESNPTAQDQELSANINKLRTGGLNEDGRLSQTKFGQNVQQEAPAVESTEAPAVESTVADTGADTEAVDTAVDVGEVGAEAGETGLAAVAAADAWNPIGWIIGAGLAIGGIAEAASSVGDQAKASVAQKVADQVKLPQQRAVDFAGSTVVAVQNSLARTQ